MPEMLPSVKPLVSVIMNCFNGEAFLREAVESLLRQEYEHWELIFWDNQSDDTSATIIQSFDDERIRYFYAEEHTGLGKARSLALAKTTGEWVGFLDVDDLWFSNKLGRQMEAIDESHSNISIVYCRCEYFCDKKDANGGSVRERKTCPGSHTLPQENLDSELYFGNFIPFPSLLYKRDALIAIGGIPPYKHPPDYYMSLAIALRFSAIAVDEVLCGYRLHDSNLSHFIREDGYRESVDIVRKLAPAGQGIRLSRYNVTRYVIYLLREKRLRDALEEIHSIGIGNFIGGLIGLMRYRHRYSCGR